MQQNQDNNEQSGDTFKEGRAPGTTLSEAIAKDNAPATGDHAVDQPLKKTYPTPADENGYFYASAEDEAEGERSRMYPTPPDEDGFIVEDETMDAMDMASKTYENDNKIIRVKLSKGRTAIVRELVGTEGMKAAQIAGKSAEKLKVAYAALSTKIDDKTYVMEDLMNFKSKDLNKLILATQLLNF